MQILLDTCILGRLANTADPDRATALAALAKLRRRGETLFITPQNLVEFRNFATRPIRVNGLGLTVPIAESLSASFEAQFPLLPETPDLFPAWKTIVGNLNIVGKLVHDARLVAVGHVHSISHVLTFNVAHFTHLATASPGIVVVDPVTV